MALVADALWILPAWKTSIELLKSIIKYVLYSLHLYIDIDTYKEYDKK